MGDISLMRCEECGLTWNAAFRSALVAYDEYYENEQAFSALFDAHVDSRAAVVAEAARPLRFLEIACGQGRFMRRVIDHAGERFESAEGFDPAWRQGEAEGPAGAYIHKRYFEPGSASELRTSPNVAAMRLAIAHVERPVDFLAGVRAALGSDGRGTLFVETPCVDWAFRNGAMQDICYEHYTNFTARALARALERAGFASVEVEHVLGGQYLWARASLQPGPSARDSVPPLPPAQVVHGRDAFVEVWRAELAKAAARGRVAIWGAAAKGLSFAVMMGGREAGIDHAVDINPGKQGLFAPVTGLRVLSPEESTRRDVSTYFVTNPIYLDEIRDILHRLGSKARLAALQ